MDATYRLYKRHYCDYKPTLQERYDCYSRWNSWGRWMVASMILIGIIFLFTCIFCANRRRAEQGNAPIKYTGWFMPWQAYPPQQQYGYPVPMTSSYQHPVVQNQPWQSEYPAPPYEPPNASSSSNPQPSIPTQKEK
ncbi:hypothetical protein T552_02944 [Pneumocystis carinii B80]|uniref:Uncharacterized protein n=1 Tax=Pneumocystis carinii (strain B80) TaxID=1408658 RepID=A0A0W4ZDL0_PNEC8|nr:hypothetical protein T552_02944 [Pneumocystis carinii B80]KTW26465.1 hypothetical protein T552_02944 [Pneumocystis carinii B80]